MDDSLLVRRREPVRDLHRVARGSCVGQRRRRPTRSRSGLAFEQFRNQVAVRRRAPDVEHREDVGMVQRRDRARFLLEAAQALGIAGKRMREGL